MMMMMMVMMLLVILIIYIIIIIINVVCQYRFVKTGPKTLRPSAVEETETYQLTEQSLFHIIVSICSFLEQSTLKMPAHTVSVRQRCGGLRTQ